MYQLPISRNAESARDGLKTMFVALTVLVTIIASATMSDTSVASAEETCQPHVYLVGGMTPYQGIMCTERILMDAYQRFAEEPGTQSCFMGNGSREGSQPVTLTDSWDVEKFTVITDFYEADGDFRYSTQHFEYDETYLETNITWVGKCKPV